MLREQLQKVLAESPKTTFEKHKIIMKILVELRMELDAKRKVERDNGKPM